MSPFITLMVESIFGLILASFYTISENPFNDMKKLYESSDGGKYVLLIFLLFFVCNKNYSYVANYRKNKNNDKEKDKE